MADSMHEMVSPVLFQRPPLSLTLADAAAELGVSRGTLETIINQGGLKCHKLTQKGDRRIAYAELVRYVESQTNRGVI